MLEKNMQTFGFSPSEIKIYLYLIKRESSYANKISSETGINRTNVYEALDRLISKGVISFITKNKMKWFEAKSIDSLNTFIAEKEDEFKKTKENFIKDIRKEKKSITGSKEYSEASIFVGRKGLRMLFEEMLETEKPLYFFAANTLQFKKFFGAYFEQWHKRRAEKGINQKTIFSNSVKQELTFGKKLWTYKFVSDEYMSPTTTILFGNTTLLIQWSKEPLAIKIKNKEITKSHLNYFNLIWNSN